MNIIPLTFTYRFTTFLYTFYTPIGGSNGHFGFKSIYSVQKHLAQLEAKGVIRIFEKGRKRSIILDDEGKDSVTIPLAGTVAAGEPIEAIEQQDRIEVPKEMIRGGDYFGLRVKGSSMIDDGILDGDVIILRKQSTARNGETVVALVDGNATLKKFYRKGDKIELQPANRTMSTIIVHGGDFSIQGIVVGLNRRYE